MSDNTNAATAGSYDEKFMRRALCLAARGFGDTAPNPMVGSVIVSADGRIIGEGWHRRCGEGHAEVNAVASVSEVDRGLLVGSTMYVTLEPCSHWGRTPPCAQLIVNCGIPRVIVGATDPYEKVSGRGIAMLRDAGVEVVTGVLAEESRRLNAMFMTANGSGRRPFVTLKFAQSADGYIDWKRTPAHPGPCRFSNSLTKLGAHRLRAAHQAILCGSGTALADRPRLDNRLWTGPGPVPVILDRRGRVMRRDLPEGALVLSGDTSPEAVLSELYGRGIQSVLVEGGSSVLQSFLDSGLWDAMRVETAGFILGSEGAVKSPRLPGAAIPLKTDGVLCWYSNNQLFTSDNPLCR